MPLAVACVMGVLTLAPVGAAAQKGPFIDAFIELHTLLSGTYGDEGPRAVAALDRMAASLAAWESATQKAELELKAALAGPSDVALLYLRAPESGR